MAIQSFADKGTETFFLTGETPKRAGWAGVAAVARRKLDMLHYAAALRGDLAGLHSIRINDQWRIVFRWTSAGPEEVRIVDYH